MDDNANISFDDVMAETHRHVNVTSITIDNGGVDNDTNISSTAHSILPVSQSLINLAEDKSAVTAQLRSQLQFMRCMKYEIKIYKVSQ